MSSLSPDGLNLSSIRTKSFSGSYTAGTWYDMDVDRTTIESGVYIYKAFVDTFNVGPSQYQCVGSSNPFSWNKTYSSNGGMRPLITWQTSFMGHAANTYTDPNSMWEMGIKHNYSGVPQELQIKFASNLTGLDNSTGGKVLRFYLYKLQ